MTIDEAIVAYLKTLPAVTKLVGARIYPSKLPQKPTYPAIVFHILEHDEDDTMEGPSGFTKLGIEFDALGATHAIAKEVSDAVRLGMNGFRGSMGSVDVQAVFRTGETPSYDDEFEVWVRAVTYEVQFSEDH